MSTERLTPRGGAVPDQESLGSARPTSIDDLDDAATLATLLIRAARRWPDRPCLATPEGDRTFREVEDRSRRFAGRLIEAGLRSGDHVIVCLDKSPASFEVVHGVLRAGAVMVPVDPLAPKTTVQRIARDTGAKAVIVDGHSIRRFGFPDEGPLAVPGGAQLDIVVGVGVDDRRVVDVELACSSDRGRPLPEPAPSDAAYVIFTSGSTGEPKGMVHTHRSGLAYARLAVETHGITADDRLAGMPPLHFDMSTLELYAAPLAGASVVPISSVELRLPASFVTRAEAERTTIWYSVPFQYRQIEQRGALERRDLSPLRMVIYAGEPYPPGALVDLMTALPGVTVVNAYGPAETNVCTVHELAGPPTTDVPLGRPWGSVEVRIVDPTAETTRRDDPEEVPLGEVGELWVSAPTVMAGYLGLPELTEERLVPREGDGDPWYRTGDLVRSDGEGRLWYLGRIDHQVKIRGVRLELEAVEAVVGSAPGVAHAVVGPSADGTHLAAVVVPIDGHDLDQRALTRFCAAQLASVAVPERFDLWEAFPQGSSGKIDRRSVRADLAVAPPNEES